jgi:hypothetical protein
VIRRFDNKSKEKEAVERIRHPFLFFDKILVSFARDSVGNNKPPAIQVRDDGYIKNPHYYL